MKKNLILFLVLFSVIISSEKNLNLEYDEIVKRIQSIISNPESPLLAGGLAVIKNNETIFCKSLGTARLNRDGTENKTSNEFIKYRTASISKLFTAIAIWQLEEIQILQLL